MRKKLLDQLMFEYDYKKNSAEDTFRFLLDMATEYQKIVYYGDALRIEVNHEPSRYKYQMERLDNGIIINLGGRSLPF